MGLRDADLLSVQEARSLAARAKAAQQALAGFSQEQVDRIVDAAAQAARAQAAERLARLAHEETGFGNVADKTKKNLFAAVDVHDYIRPLRTVGILREDKGRRVVEIAEPMGVVAAVIPSTNPTSTAICKALISLKARDAIVMSPAPVREGLHPRGGQGDARTRGRGGHAARRAGLHDRGLARGHPGADALPRHRRDPGHRRHRPRARRVLVRQARLRRGAGQRARLHREDGRRADSGPARDRRQDLRLRHALLVRAVDRVRRGDCRRRPGGGPEERRLLPERGGSRQRSRGWW